MKGILRISCDGCGKYLGYIIINTVDEPERVQDKINRVILAHQDECRYYRNEVK